MGISIDPRKLDDIILEVGLRNTDTSSSKISFIRYGDEILEVGVLGCENDFADTRLMEIPNRYGKNSDGRILEMIRMPFTNDNGIRVGEYKLVKNE